MSSFKRETRHKATCEYRNLNLNLEQCVSATRTCVTRNLVIRSGSLLFSLDRIISSMSPCSFSITTNTRSGVSNMHSKLTMPGWCRFWGRTQNTSSLHWFKNNLDTEKSMYCVSKGSSQGQMVSLCAAFTDVFWSLPVIWPPHSWAGSPAWLEISSCQ